MVNTCYDCGKSLRIEDTYVVPEPTDPVGEYCRTVCVDCSSNYKQTPTPDKPIPDSRLFGIGFAPQVGTSIPIDDVLSYCSRVGAITEKAALLQHLQTRSARLSDLQMQQRRYGLLFSLQQPFPHLLFIRAKHGDVAGLLDLVEIVDGTSYEVQFCRVLCLYKFFPSQQAYRAWKSQQDRIRLNLL
jgi:hypothetical protein